METLAEKWLKDVIGVWLVDTEPRDEYVHCFYVLNYKGDKASYSWKGQNSDRNFEYLEAIFEDEEFVSMRHESMFDFGFNTLSQCSIINNSFFLDKLQSEMAKVLLTA